MKFFRLYSISAVMLSSIVVAQEILTEAQVNEAIALGKSGNVPVVRIGSFLGDFDVFLEGPVARIAAAANAATKQFRPFDAAQVTREMASLVYTIHAQQSRNGRRAFATRIVLQPKGAKGMDGVIQPVREGGLASAAVFDRLPEGEFQVVVVTSDGPQRYTVNEKDRAKIR